MRASVRATISVAAIAPRLGGDLDLQHHVLDRHDAAARRMAALLGHLLVLDLDRRDARRLVAAHRALHVQQAAVAGVGVGDQRRVDHRADHLGAAHHVGIGREARVGQAEHRGGRAVAGHVERREAHAVGDARRDAVVDAGRQDELALGQPSRSAPALTLPVMFRPRLSVTVPERCASLRVEVDRAGAAAAVRLGARTRDGVGAVIARDHGCRLQQAGLVAAARRRARRKPAGR